MEPLEARLENLELNNNPLEDEAEKSSRKDEGLYCKLFIQRKNRNCRMLRQPNQDYCAEHVVGKVIKRTEEIEDDVLDRQPCPLDPKHTVSKSKLSKHLKKCNSRPPDKAYYQAAANTISPCDTEEAVNFLTMTLDKRIEIIMQLIQLHQREVSSIPDYFGIHDYLMAGFVRSDVGESALRHSTQIGSIVKIMDEQGLLKDSTCFIEFGSGRGGLSLGIARVAMTMGLKNCKFILIDRTSPRYKWDNRIKNDVMIQRIKISIEDLLVGKLPDITKYDNIVGLSKHLCGSGTDLALRSLFEEKSNSERAKVRGVVFATCCHHRTEYADLVGNDRLPSDFSGGNFRSLKQIAAWATNGDYTSSIFKDGPPKSELIESFFKEIEEVYPEITLKNTVGRLVKELIDNYRAQYIADQSKDVGLVCKLVHYVDMTTTRENVAIVAYPSG